MMRDDQEVDSTTRGGADNARQLMRSHTMSRTTLLRLRATLRNIHAIACNEEAGHVLLPQQRHKFDDILLDSGKCGDCVERS